MEAAAKSSHEMVENVPVYETVIKHIPLEIDMGTARYLEERGKIFKVPGIAGERYESYDLERGPDGLLRQIVTRYQVSPELLPPTFPTPTASPS